MITRQAAADLVGVAGADHVEVGDRPQRGELLDRLMGRAVLAEPDRVVAEPVDHRQLHQRREPDRRAGVVGEDQVGGPDRPQLREREAVGDRRRLVLADPVMEGAPGPVGGLEVAAPSKSSPLAAEPVRSAEPPAARAPWGDRVRAPGGRPCGSRCPSRPGRSSGISASQPSGSSRRCIWSICTERPGRPRRRAASTRRAGGSPLADPGGEVLVDAVGDEELGVLGPAVGALGLPHLLVAERLAVGGRGVLLVRRAVADVAVDDDQGRAAALLPESARRRG